MKYQMVYHGTNEITARRIQKQGFEKGTYFAKHLEDAVGYGGEYVFEVMYPTELIPENWQFIIGKTLSPRSIVSLKRYKTTTKFDSETLRAQVSKSNMTPGELKYLIADIRRNPKAYTKAEQAVFNPQK